MLKVDTREKKWAHIESYLISNDIAFECVKLDVGDYMVDGINYVTVDRKADLQEVCTNLQCGKNNHSRFVRECEKAKKLGIKLVVLIEKNLEMNDVKRWKSKYSNHTGSWLHEQMFRLSLAYDVEWQFCRKSQTPKRIFDILTDDKYKPNNFDFSKEKNNLSKLQKAMKR